MRKNIVKQWFFLTAFCLLCSNTFATTGVPTATTKPVKPITPIQGPAATQLPGETPSPNGTTTPTSSPSPNGIMAPTSTSSPSGTMTPADTASPASTQTPQTAPGSSSNGKKTQPFILDNFKVIEATLGHFGVDSAKLADYIRQGKKLEDVLKAEKISVKKFKKQVVTEYFKAVEQGLDEGQLTEEQANQLKNAIQETVKGWLPRK